MAISEVYLVFSKESSKKNGAAVSNKDHIQQEKCTCWHKNSEAGTVGVLKKRSVTLLLERGSIITAKFSRILILKNICERLLVKISILVTNSGAVAQRSSIKKVFLEILQNSQ